MVLLCLFRTGPVEMERELGRDFGPTSGVILSGTGCLGDLPWGVENIPPVRSTGWLIQNESGTCYLSLDQDTIRVYTDQTSIVIQPNRVDAVVPDEVDVVTGQSRLNMVPRAKHQITVGGATFTMTPSQIVAQLGSSRLTLTNGNCELRAAGTLTLRGNANTVVL